MRIGYVRNHLLHYHTAVIRPVLEYCSCVCIQHHNMETLIAKRKQRFMTKYVQSDNVLRQLFAHVESV